MKLRFAHARSWTVAAVLVSLSGCGDSTNGPGVELEGGLDASSLDADGSAVVDATADGGKDSSVDAHETSDAPVADVLLEADGSADVSADGSSDADSGADSAADTLSEETLDEGTDVAAEPQPDGPADAAGELLPEAAADVELDAVADGATSIPCGDGGTCGLLEECWSSTLCVAKAVPVAGGFSIDATEVTRSQYEAWLAAGSFPSTVPSYCLGNTSYTPDSSCMANSSVCQGACANHPQACVDWCDAYAYCGAIGKRLCGKIGGGALGFNEYADDTKSQWYQACSANGGNLYPYGSTYEAQTCNGSDSDSTGCDHGACTTAQVASLPACETNGSYSGVYDLSGNVWEWEDSCSANLGMSDLCRVRGGSFTQSADGVRCDYGAGGYILRDGTGLYQPHDLVGFRCCSQ